MADDRHTEAALDDFWNDLGAGKDDAADNLDPGLIDTVRAFRRLAAVPPPDSSRDRVDQALRRQSRGRQEGGSDHGLGGNVAAPWSPSSPNGRSPHLPPPATSVGRFGPRWLVGQVALAALLLLTLVAGLLVLRVVRPGGVVSPTGPLVEALLDATIETPLEGWTPVGVERWTFQPGPATLRVPPLDGPQWIVADDGAFLAAVDGGEQTLSPGAAVVVPAGQTLVLRNLGSRESAVLRGVVATGFALEEFDRVAIDRRQVLNNEALVALPSGLSRVVFSRLTLPPGTALPPQAAREHDWFVAISAGRLGMTLAGASMPTGWHSGVERELEAGGRIPVLVPGTWVTLRNVGEEPLVGWRLTVLSADPIVGAPAAAAMHSVGGVRLSGRFGLVGVTGAAMGPARRRGSPVGGERE